MLTNPKVANLARYEERREPPANIEAEQALLGAILVNNDAYHRVSNFLEARHFIEDLHQRIYEVAGSLINAGQVATPKTLKTFLGDQELGGITVSKYLARLAAEATTVINAESYARIVRDLFLRRRMIDEIAEIVRGAYDAPVDSPAAVQLCAAEQRLSALARLASADEAPLIKSSAEFRTGFTPPDYLINGILQRRFCYSLTAPTGTGKTNILLLIAACIALGRSFAGRYAERGRVLFFAGENPDDVRMRWIALAEHMGFDPDAIEVYFIPGTFKIADLKRRIRREAERIGGFALVGIDTSAAYFPGSDENNNVEMGAHVREMRELTTLPGGPCVLIACHPVKNATTDNLMPRGGGAFVAEVDGNLVCVKNGDSVSLHWQVKFRGPDFEPIPFENRTVTAAALKDSKSNPIPTVVARLLSDDEQQQKGAGARADEDMVLAVLDEHEEISIAGICNQFGWLTSKGKPLKSKAQRALESLKGAKLVALERGHYALTTKGRAAAKKVKAKYNLAALIPGS